MNGFRSIGENEEKIIIDETAEIPPFYFIGEGVPWQFYFFCGISFLAASSLVYFFGSTIIQMNYLSQTEIEYVSFFAKFFYHYCNKIDSFHKI